MSDEGRKNLSREILRLIGSQITYNDLAVGEYVHLMAEDGQTLQKQELVLQFLGLHDVSIRKDPVAVFAISTSGFTFYGDTGLTTVEAGTLALAGYAMTWLPRPISHMVGIGGIGVGRDYSLNWVGGVDASLIIHHVLQIRIASAPKGFTVPSTVGAFLEGIEVAKASQEAKSAEQMAQARSELLSKIDAELGDVDHLSVNLIRGFCNEGIVALGSFLLHAREQGRLGDALALVKRGYNEQWVYQHPSIQGDPSYGTNRQYLDNLYTKVGVIIPVFDEKSEMPSEDDALRLRQILDNWTEGVSFREVETVDVTAVAAGQIILAQTESGNRYLFRVENPGLALVTAVAQKLRSGFPADGVFEPARCSNLEKYASAYCGQMNTSGLVAIYLL